MLTLCEFRFGENATVRVTHKSPKRSVALKRTRHGHFSSVSPPSLTPDCRRIDGSAPRKHPSRTVQIFLRRSRAAGRSALGSDALAAGSLPDKTRMGGCRSPWCRGWALLLLPGRPFGGLGWHDRRVVPLDAGALELLRGHRWRPLLCPVPVSATSKTTVPPPCACHRSRSW